ncbi:hypothetical protein CBR_g32178 [Chara braunii]|uniref:Myb/SANT-like DNA-binding domain-containing protein n=1 Tax=Chara braunii TaxID=69332 RepID=A0A388JN77_CHABU|nr:hypothetical protein CBR_g32178 [Chara braunii]|eukprot:GBG59162.1 hypothetical protein CBR_g32178 [Chara braunii]
MVALIRAKRDQDVQLQMAGHAFAQMKGREWKWADVRERLLKVDVDRPAEKCGKKWDNLMQQFKKVHCFQGESGKEDFFQLSAKERLARGLNFNMDRAVYEEIKASTTRSHTMHLQNVADTGRVGDVQLPFGSSGGPESVSDGESDAGGDGNDEDDSSTRGCSQTTGSPGGARKRKNMRQQTFEALTECMEKHGTLMASTMESASKGQCSIQIRQCKAMEAEMEVQKKRYVASDEVSKMMCHALMEIVKAIRDRAGQAKRGRDVLENVMPVVEKKGRHQAKKRKAVAGGPSNAGKNVREEWVNDGESTKEDDAIQSGEEEAVARKGSLRTRGALKINGTGAAQAAHQPRGGGAREREDVVIDVDAGVAPREVRGMASITEVRTAGALTRTRTTTPPEGDPSVRAPSSPATPRQQPVKDDGGGSNTVVQGSGVALFPA